MEDKNIRVTDRIKAEISKIEKKENHIYFFVFDTKGNPSGSLEYIYRLAKLVKDDGYNVTMLHQEEEFVGVEEWLGEEFASIQHENVASGDIAVSPSDILFIPEIFSQIMNKTKSLPCKRVAILQNYNWMLEQMPFSAKWNTFGINEAITNTELNYKRLKEVFSSVKTTVINPYISRKFHSDSKPKNLVVNIVADDQADISKIVKPFYWKYPNFNWVSFKDLRGLPKEAFAEELRRGAITICVDEDASFGYSIFEALQSGSLVMAKVPNNSLGWNIDENGELKNCCIWFDNYDFLHKQLASVVRAWTKDAIPSVLSTEAGKITYLASEEITKKQILNFISGISDNRIAEMKNLINNIDKNDKNENSSINE